MVCKSHDVVFEAQCVEIESMRDYFKSVGNKETKNTERGISDLIPSRSSHEDEEHSFSENPNQAAELIISHNEIHSQVQISPADIDPQHELLH